MIAIIIVTAALSNCIVLVSCSVSQTAINTVRVCPLTEVRAKAPFSTYRCLHFLRSCSKFGRTSLILWAQSKCTVGPSRCVRKSGRLSQLFCTLSRSVANLCYPFFEDSLLYEWRLMNFHSPDSKCSRLSWETRDTAAAHPDPSAFSQPPPLSKSSSTHKVKLSVQHWIRNFLAEATQLVSYVQTMQLSGYSLLLVFWDEPVQYLQVATKSHAQ